MERTNPEPIGSLVERLIKDYHLDKPLASNKACWLWGEIVGPGINRATTRRYVREGVLHVWIDSAPLKNELTFHRTNIMDAINKELGDFPITEIRIH